MSKKLLIVDDAAFMRMMLKDILKNEDYEIEEASNGYEAIEKYKEFKPDLVTMDITMPELDGIGALKGIKEVDKDATVIMCSAMGQQEMVLDAVKEGAKDFIVKPFQKERVLEAVGNILV